MGGNDTLTGGAGRDTLRGNEGDDTYTFASADGIDTIEDAAGQNTIQFRDPANTVGTAITLASVVAQRVVGAGPPAMSNHARYRTLYPAPPPSRSMAIFQVTQAHSGGHWR
jgi:Ca2+-binding RTX toxin-like protein